MYECFSINLLLIYIACQRAEIDQLNTLFLMCPGVVVFYVTVYCIYVHNDGTSNNCHAASYCLYKIYFKNISGISCHYSLFLKSLNFKIKF